MSEHPEVDLFFKGARIRVDQQLRVVGRRLRGKILC